MRIKHLLLSAALISTFSLPGIGIESQDKDAIETKLLENKTQEVILRLKQVLKANPKDKEARLLLAKSHFQLHDLESAKKELIKARELGIAQADWMPLLAEIYLMERSFDRLKSELNLDKISSKDPSTPWLQKMKVIHADAYLARNKIKQAKALLDSVLAYEPSNVDAWIGISQGYLIENKLEHAVKSLSKAKRYAELSGNSEQKASVLVLQAEAAKLRKEYDEALNHYHVALQVEPSNLSARIGLVQIYLMQKNKKAFIEQAKALYKTAPQYILSLYYYALVQLEEKEIDRARETLEKLVRYQPKHEPSLFLLSKIYYMQRRYETADRTLQKYLTLRPENIQAKALQAAIRIKQKEPEKGIAILEPLIKKKPLPQWEALLGQAYVLHGDLDKGVEWLKKASQSLPENAQMGVDLAATLMANQKADKAESVLNDVLSHHEDFQQAELLMVFVSLKNGNYHKAEVSANKLLKANPRNSVYHNLLALSFMAQKKHGAAEAHFLNALSIAPNFMGVRNNLSELYIHTKDFVKAEHILQGTLKEDPSNLRALLLSSHMSELQGDFEAALKWLKTARDRNPTRFELVPQIVRLHMRMKQSDEAFKQAQAGVERFPDRPELKLLLGELALARRNYQNAFAVLQSLSEKYPKNTKVLQGLARAQSGLNLPDKANTTIDQVIKQEPSNILALIVKAEINQRAKNFERVRETAKKIIELNPKNPIGYRVYGEALIGKGLAKPAVPYFEEAYKLSENANYAKAYFRALKYNHELKKGFDLLEAYLKKHPDDVDMRRYLATAYLVNKNTDKARKHFSAILKVAKDDIVSLNNLAQAYLQSDDANKAHEYAKKAYNLNPNNLSIADTFAWTLILKNQAPKAIPILTTAIMQNPKSHDLRYHRAVGLYNMGQKAQALTELEALVGVEDSFPDKEQAHQFLKKIKSQQG